MNTIHSGVINMCHFLLNKPVKASVHLSLSSNLSLDALAVLHKCMCWTSEKGERLLKEILWCSVKVTLKKPPPLRLCLSLFQEFVPQTNFPALAAESTADNPSTVIHPSLHVTRCHCFYRGNALIFVALGLSDISEMCEHSLSAGMNRQTSMRCGTCMW